MADTPAAATPDDALHAERVLIVDFGSQVTQLIARRVRESGVYSEIHPFNAVDDEFLRAFAPKAVILSGGPASAGEEDTPKAPDGLWGLGVPVLGICYGEMTMAQQLGGQVEPSATQEFGRTFIDITAECKLFEGIWKTGETHQVWMSHGDKIDAIPDGFHPVAVTGTAPFAAIADEERRFY